MRTEFTGGEVTLSFDRWKEWETTIPTDPENVDYTTEPIFEAVKKNHPKRDNIKRAFDDYIIYHQRERQGPRVVPDCNHLKISYTSSYPNITTILGNFDCYVQNSQRYATIAIIVKGPNERDECLVSYVYGTNGSDERKRNSFRVYSESLRWEAEKSCEMQCQRNKNETSIKNEKKSCFSDWNNWMASFTILPNNMQVRIPTDYYKNSGPIQGNKEEMRITSGFTCMRVCPFGNFASYAAIYQPRIIPDKKK